MIRFKFDWEGMPELKEHFSKMGLALRGKVQERTAEAALNVQREARRAAPSQTGSLRRSIQIRSFANRMSWECYTENEYAAFVEFGTANPGRNSIDEVGKKWAEIHGYEHGNRKEWLYLHPKTKRLVKTSGREAKPFLFPAVEAERRAYIDDLKKLVKGLEKS